jgi:membrane associated rhomboid family serine protease
MGQIRRTIEGVFDDLTITLNVVSVLAIFFFLRFFPLPVSSDTLIWLFLAQADPSPGWILAPLLHEGTTHFLANIGQLLYFGIVPEQNLRPREYVGFLVVTGVLSTLAVVAQYNFQGIEGGLAGASGATMAVMGFAVGSIGLFYLGRTDDPGVSAEWNLRIILFGMAIFLSIVRLTSDFYPGWSLTPHSSGVAHLTGFALGLGYSIVDSRRTGSIL